MADQILAPVFFATAGLQVDLLGIVRPPVLGWTLAIIAVAVTGKVLGGWMGARLGGFSNRDGLAVGIGLNARGALEIVVASVGLSLGVLSTEAYSAVVVMAVVTSLMAPPLLTLVLGLTPHDGTEEEDASLFAGMRTALLPTRGGDSSVLAGRLTDAVLPATATLTALTVHRAADDARAGRLAARTLADHVGRRMRWRDHISDDPARELLSESVLGYDMIAVGSTADPLAPGVISETLRRIMSGSAIPVVLVRNAPDTDPGSVHLGRIMAGVTGSASSTMAVDLATRVAASQSAELTLVHVADALEPVPVVAGTVAEAADPAHDEAVRAQSMQNRTFAAADEVLDGPRRRATEMGVGTTTELRRARHVGEQIVESAVLGGADLVVVGAEQRSRGGAFLGHTVAHLLEHAPMSVAVVISPRG